LAELCQLSTGYFHRCFKEYTGMSALEYQKKQLMNKVLQLLHCNKSLVEIAKMFNYSSSFSLSRDFKLFYGYSPRDYKRMNGLQKGKSVIKD
jgi:AraC-like DNA-binding protein